MSELWHETKFHICSMVFHRGPDFYPRKCRHPSPSHRRSNRARAHCTRGAKSVIQRGEKGKLNSSNPPKMMTSRNPKRPHDVLGKSWTTASAESERESEGREIYESPASAWW